LVGSSSTRAVGALAREPGSVAAFDAEVSLAAGQNPVLDAHVESTRRLLREVADDAVAAANARRLVEQLALALQASLLVRTAPSAVSDAFMGRGSPKGMDTSTGCCPPEPT